MNPAVLVAGAAGAVTVAVVAWVRWAARHPERSVEPQPSDDELRAEYLELDAQLRAWWARLDDVEVVNPFSAEWRAMADRFAEAAEPLVRRREEIAALLAMRRQAVTS